MSQHTRPSNTTREEEQREAAKPHEAGREPTAEEAAAADRNDVDPSVREAYEDALERGAKQEGEGKPGI
jgi:hypothetical protein